MGLAASAVLLPPHAACPLSVTAAATKRSRRAVLRRSRCQWDRLRRARVVGRPGRSSSRLMANGLACLGADAMKAGASAEGFMVSWSESNSSTSPLTHGRSRTAMTRRTCDDSICRRTWRHRIADSSAASLSGWSWVLMGSSEAPGSFPPLARSR